MSSVASIVSNVLKWSRSIQGVGKIETKLESKFLYINVFAAIFFQNTLARYELLR